LFVERFGWVRGARWCQEIDLVQGEKLLRRVTDRVTVCIDDT